jgi:hypothetical protein
MKLQSMQVDRMAINPCITAAQPVTVERAGQAAKHPVASIHPVVIPMGNIADKPHYVN